MTPDTSNLTSAIAVENARSAFLNDDRNRTRYWARVALSIDPKCEDAWLLLAAVASPRASLGYFKSVLAINPENMQAKSGIKWAARRISTTSSARHKEGKSTPPVEANSKNKLTNIVPARNFSTRKFLLAITAIVIVAIFFISNHYTQAVFGLSSSTEPTLIPTLTAGFRVQQPPAQEQLPTTLPTLPSPSPRIAVLSHSIETPLPSPTPLPTDLPADGTPRNQNSLLVQDPQNLKSKWILVDISEQHMYVYESNNLIYSFVASTGINNGTRT